MKIICELLGVQADLQYLDARDICWRRVAENMTRRPRLIRCLDARRTEPASVVGTAMQIRATHVN